MMADDIPGWVPQSVRQMAVMLNVGHPMAKRFLADPAMEGVWSYLQTRRIWPGFLDRVLHNPYIFISDKNKTTQAEQAAACLFYTVIVAANNSRVVVYKKVIDKVIRELKDTIKKVNDLRYFEPAPELEISEEVHTAISTIIEYCKDRIVFIDPRDKPSVLAAEGRPPSTDPIRACVREIGSATYALYGDCLYGQLATIANVMFKPDLLVTATSTENWCTKVPLPIREKHKWDPSH